MTIFTSTPWAPGDGGDFSSGFGKAYQAQIGGIVAHRVVDLIRAHVLHVQLGGGIPGGEFLLQAAHFRKAGRVDRDHPHGAFHVALNGLQRQREFFFPA
jgi:hypothetical protein